MKAWVGDRRDGLVPVLDLDRVERDVDDVAIRSVLRHLDPVTHVDHVVAGDLDAGDEERIVSLKISSSTAVIAPMPLTKIQGDLSSRVATMPRVARR